MKAVNAFKGQMSDSFTAAFFLILSGGFQDAYTYICRGKVFANAQTGNIVLLSTALFQGEWVFVLKYFVPIFSFVVGIAVAECIHMHLKSFEKIHWRQLILLMEMVLLFFVGFLPNAIDPLANALVSFVCAMQVQAFNKLRGHTYASTMCIGNLRSGTEALYTYFCKRDNKILRKALTYFSVILVFGAGAGLGSILTRTLGIKAILFSCILLFVSFAVMFIHEK